MKVMKRQGDILFVKARGEGPSTERKAVNGRLVIAVGEKTGHDHTADAIALRAYGSVDGRGPASWLEVALETTVEHQEHGPVTLEPGKWEVVAQKEYEAPRSRYAYD